MKRRAWWGAALVFLLPALAMGSSDTEFRGELLKRSLRYFVDQAHPVSGLIPDRAAAAALDCNLTKCPREYRMASMAATGFGLAVFAHAAKTGLMPREDAVARIERALRFVQAKLFHYRGWLYHFVDVATGARWDRSEISTIDTALFLAGALYAGQLFPDTAIPGLVTSLYDRVDFPDMMHEGGKYPAKRTLSMGWFPESGYLPYQWDTYAEHMILVLLGLGHRAPLPPEAWSVWKRPKLGDVLGPELPLFAHQYSHLFVDFQGKKDGLGDYWNSSIAATKRDRELCASDARYRTYREGFWGLSASGSAGGYQAFSPIYHDGTVCLGCAGASLPFLPTETLDSMKRWATGPYAPRIWGRYGFLDSLNLEPPWFDPDVIGITVGALYLATAALDPATAVSVDFEKIPAIRRGLARAGLSPSDR